MGGSVDLIQFISTLALSAKCGLEDATDLHDSSLVFLVTTEEPYHKATPAPINLGTLNAHRAHIRDAVGHNTLFGSHSNPETLSPSVEQRRSLSSLQSCSLGKGFKIE